MKRLTRDKWLDQVLTDKSLSDKEVAEFLKLYALLGVADIRRPKPTASPPEPPSE